MILIERPIITTLSCHVYGKNLAKKTMFPVLFYSVLATLKKKNLSSKICFRFRLIYICKFICQYMYSITETNQIYRTRSVLKII